MLEARFIKLEKKDIEDAEKFSKKIVQIAADENISMEALLIAADALKTVVAIQTVERLNESDKPCDCENCKKQREDMN